MYNVPVHTTRIQWKELHWQWKLFRNRIYQRDNWLISENVFSLRANILKIAGPFEIRMLELVLVWVSRKVKEFAGNGEYAKFASDWAFQPENFSSSHELNHFTRYFSDFSYYRFILCEMCVCVCVCLWIIPFERVIDQINLLQNYAYIYVINIRLCSHVHCGKNDSKDVGRTKNERKSFNVVL